MGKRYSVIIVIFLIFLIISLLFLKGNLFSNSPNLPPSSTPTSSPAEVAKIISTKPDPLNDAVIPADTFIEITFNKPLQHATEFKHRLEPQIDYQIELSADKKTAKIIPAQPYELGAEYTLSVLFQTNFEGGEKLSEEKVYHFKTVKFRGL